MPRTPKAKTVVLFTRVEQHFAERVQEAARERGMTLGEFIRYALNQFFDRMAEYKVEPSPWENNGGENCVNDSAILPYPK